MTGTIYVIRNYINKKVYVGQSVNVNQRWIQHKTAARHINNQNNNHSILYAAMRKYGIDNFYLEILEDGIPNNKLNEREAFWIQECNSVRPNGYNILPGNTIGEQYKRSIYQLDKNNYSIIQSFESIVEASEITGIYLSGIHKVLNNRLLTAGGYRWCYKEQYENYITNPPCRKNNSKDNQHKRSGKSILQLDKDTRKIINIWDSVKDASEALNVYQGSIYKALCGSTQTCKGFIWEYK